MQLTRADVAVIANGGAAALRAVPSPALRRHGRQHDREDCMKITFGETALPKSGAVVVGVSEGSKLTPSAAELDRRTGGVLKRAIAASRFTGKKDELLSIVAPAKLALSRIVLAGLGKPSAGPATHKQPLAATPPAHLKPPCETAAPEALSPHGGSHHA